MKTSGILTIAAAGALLAGCADVSDVTKISGTVKAEAIDEVNVTVPEMSIDTLVPVKDGKFYLEVPANPVVFGAISAASYGVNFIPDGTEIDVVIAEESSAVSRKSGSVQSRFVSYQEKVKTIMNDFNTSVQAIMADTSISEDERKAMIDSNYNAVTGSFVDFNEQVIKDNSDNVIALFALQQAAMLSEDTETQAMIGMLSPALQETESVKTMKGFGREDCKVL